MDVKVYASILGGDLANLRFELSKMEEAGADVIHIDVMDGHFVPNLTFGPPVIKAMRKYSSLPFSVHLMVTNPADYIPQLLDIGVEEIIFHLEVTPHPIRVLRKIRENGIKAGIAISPVTPVNPIAYLRGELDSILVMSVEPGFAGQKFIQSTYRKLDDLSKLLHSWERKPMILVDGGVSDKNARELVARGVRGLVCASYLFNSPSPSEAVAKLKKL